MNKVVALAILLSVVAMGCQNNKTSGSGDTATSQTEAASKGDAKDSSSDDIESGDSRSEANK